MLRRPQYRVSVRRLWTDPWQAARYLEPLAATSCAAPQKSTAVFRWRVGRIKYEDRNAFQSWPVRDLKDWFVRIELLPQPAGGSSLNPQSSPADLWIGRFADEDLRQDGNEGGTGASPLTVARADQLLTAIGIEHELDRTPIRGAWVTNDGETVVQVDTPVVFNEQFDGPSGLSDLGNRSLLELDHPEESERKAFVFAGHKGEDEQGNPQSTATLWSVGDIVRHLLAFHAPPEFAFTLSGQSAALDAIVMPRVDLAGRTVWQALNYLIDRRRGLGWCLRLDPDFKAAVHVYSVLDSAVAFDDATIEANAEQYALRLDELGHLVDETSLQLDTYGRYGKVVVSGERVLSCFTVNLLEETLEIGWTAEEEAKYRDADGGEDLAANRVARAVDELAHVYTHYHIPRSFNWMTGDGEKGQKRNANPLVGRDGRVTVNDSPQAPVRKWGRRLERHLPIRKKQSKAESEPEYLEPVVLLWDEAHAWWVHAERCDPDVSGSAYVRMLDTSFGLEVRFAPNHVLAKGLFDQSVPVGGGSPQAAKPSDKQPKYQPAKMICTVAARTDERLEVVAELVTDGPLKDRVLHLEVPDAELHYLVPGTVTGVDAATGALQKSTTQQAVLRDDGERLRRVAALATAWYGRERAAMTLTVRDVWHQYRVGALVLSASDRLGTRGVNTVVSQVSHDLVAAATTIRTNYSELDVTAGRSAGPRRTT